MDNMPYEVATALLLSGQKMTSQFKKNCQRARERVAEPQSCSTLLPISAPKTGAQRLQARLKRMNARQLIQAHKRALRRGNRLQDMLFEAEAAHLAGPNANLERAINLLQLQIPANDAICEAYQLEFDNRAKRGNVMT